MTDLINRAGITSCLTPGGQMFHLKRGREISGYEKLLLSGIPADSLLLGGEYAAAIRTEGLATAALCRC
jgi:hypothetical protein